MITYLKVAMAAVERYLLEKPIRAMYDEQNTKKYNPPFAVVVDVLRGRGYILGEHSTLILQRYQALSEVLHGRHA